MIDITKKYRTRGGCEVRVLMADGGNWNYPVIAAYKDADDRWWPLHLTADGRHCLNKAAPSALDLIEVRPRIQREVWVNVYPEYCTIHQFRDYADQLSMRDRTACVKLVIDCEEGEGL